MRDLAFGLSLGGLTFLFTVIWGGPFIEVLRRLGIGKQVRAEISDVHSAKIGTPTMGGLLILTPVLIVTLGLNIASLLVPKVTTGRSILLPLVAMVLYGGLGALDDWEGIMGTRAVGEGLSARVKFAGQVIVALGASLILMYGLDIHSVVLPGIIFKFDLGLLYLPIATLLITFMSNAVNLTDGLDGLAGIITASAFACYGVIAFMQGQIYLTQFCFTTVGACFAFLWYNAHPAQLFMGDTGALALGATLAIVALMTGQWLILPVIAIIPVAEATSVMLQVASSQLSRRLLGEDRRIFLRTPLHHHFEKLGWSETQIVQRFWLVGILAGMGGIALALL
ncbi:MAG: phospho-N-acetylmuramoyl-pentapeptide-transferase [Anaerolineae bacterium]|nr:phospho-N-acetylmuramoyl-pentapeptide-transferase [Anaerolineae bacterium]